MKPRALVKRIVYGTAWRTGAVAVLRSLYRTRIPILCYHSVVDAPLPPWLMIGGLHLPVDRFRAQMGFLARHYQVIALEDLVAAVLGHAKPPGPRSIVLTFDDGYANNLAVAAPVLREFGFPATIFLPTDYIGRGGMFWWDELRDQLAAARGRSLDVEGWGRLDLTSAGGVAQATARGERLLRAVGLDERDRLLAKLVRAAGESPRPPLAEALRPATWAECRAAPPLIRFGGHGASHRLLDEISPGEARADMERCGRAVRTELRDRASTTFCYPAGRWTPMAQSALRAAGFTSAVVAGAIPAADGLASVRDDPTLLPRVGVSSHATLQVFAGSVAGLHILLGRLMGWSSAAAAGPETTRTSGPD